MKLVIPAKKDLIDLKYEYIDSTIDQYYRPVQGFFMRKRLELALELMGDEKVERILDVGYGGGTFIPTLAKMAKEVHGIDMMPHPEKVTKILKKQGITNTKLIVGDIMKTPYKSNYFDRIVCISVMEHFNKKQLHAATKEMYRILKPGGYLIFGSPVKNPVTDFVIEYFLGFKPNDIHPSGHKQIIGAIQEEVEVDVINHYFPFLPRDFSLYFVLRVKKPKAK